MHPRERRRGARGTQTYLAAVGLHRAEHLGFHIHVEAARVVVMPCDRSVSILRMRKRAGGAAAQRRTEIARICTGPALVARDGDVRGLEARSGGLHVGVVSKNGRLEFPEMRRHNLGCWGFAFVENLRN